MKKIVDVFILLVVCLFFISVIQSCSVFTKSKPSEPAVDMYIQEGFIKATVINYVVDGCTFMLQLADGKKLQPVNLKDEFKKDNFNVWIKYQHYKGNSVCMAGEMVTITAIEKR